ncbi:MAG: LysR family transcriptional regulator [Pseudomonadota bacterium]
MRFMNEIDWDNLRLFLAVARSGGLGPAAARTGKSPPTLGRRMLELERALGRDLFLRKPRGYDLTEDGADLLSKLEGLEARVMELGNDESVPMIKISAGTWVTRVLVGAVDQIRGSRPIRLRFMASEDMADIGRREAVIGIRNRRPDGSGLAGRKIGQVRFAVYARDSGVSTWVQVLSTTPSAQWVKTKTEGSNVIEVTTPQNALDLANVGCGRAVLPTFVGRAEPLLRQVSDPIDELEHDQWLVTHHEDRFLPDVRSAIDRTYAILKRVCAQS